MKHFLPVSGNSTRPAVTNTTRPTLLEGLRDGSDAVAWGEFFELYWPLLFVLATRGGCSDHTAEEVVQEVMLTVFRQKDVFRHDPQRGRFRDWLATVTRNQIAEYRRRPAQRVRASGGENRADSTERPANGDLPDTTWEAAFEEGLLMVLLEVVRQETNPRIYQAFELFTLCELSGTEVAKLTGLSRAAVYQGRRTVFKRLQELGASYGDDGRLHQRVKRALESLPDGAVERSLTQQIEKTMRT